MTGFDESAALEDEKAEDEQAADDAVARATESDEVEALWDADTEIPDSGMTPPE